MPGTPKEQTQQAAGITLKMYVVAQGNDGYAVGYADVPGVAAEQGFQLEARLDGARDGAIRNVNGKLREEKKLTLEGKYPGREFIADVPEKKLVLRARLYIVNGRLYQTLVVGVADFANSDTATKFLDSFALAP
jgi:hypothetical protein